MGLSRAVVQRLLIAPMFPSPLLHGMSLSGAIHLKSSQIHSCCLAPSSTRSRLFGVQGSYYLQDPHVYETYCKALTFLTHNIAPNHMQSVIIHAKFPICAIQYQLSIVSPAPSPVPTPLMWPVDSAQYPCAQDLLHTCPPTCLLVPARLGALQSAPLHLTL